MNPNSSDSPLVFIGAAAWGWTKDSPEIVERRRLLRNRYASWIVRFRLLFGDAIPSTTKTIGSVDAFFAKWVERSGSYDHSVPRTASEAKNAAKKRLAGFSKLLNQIEGTRTDGTTTILDTNALLAQSDISAFGSIDAQGVVLLVLQVLRNLDELKDRGRTPELRDKASKAIRQIKGLPDRGNIPSGVKVAHGLRAQAVGVERNFDELPDSLDPDVPDDRIIGAILMHQVSHPDDVVVFVANDISAQIKAAVHGVPFVEVPAPAAGSEIDQSARRMTGYVAPISPLPLPGVGSLLSSLATTQSTLSPERAITPEARQPSGGEGRVGARAS